MILEAMILDIVLFVLFLAILALLVLMIATSWVTVGKEEYMVLNWRIFSLPGPRPGHFMAVGLRQGIQAKIYTAGVRFIPFVNIFAEIIKKPLRKIPQDKYGMIIAKDGETPKAGTAFTPQLVAEKVVDCDNYSDGEKFLLCGGQRGIQITPPLPPGDYAINDFLFDLVLIDPVKIAPKPKEKGDLTEGKAELVPQIGVVTLNIGQTMPPGQVVGHKVHGHRSFQNIANFVGPQVKDPEDDEKKQLQRGLQEEVLIPGSYVLIPEIVNVKLVEVTFISEGQVGVIISSVGGTPTTDEIEPYGIPLPGKIGKTSDADRSVGYVLKKKAGSDGEIEISSRGISPDVLNPGFVPYRFANPVAYKIIPVDTTQITIDWTTPEEFKQHRHESPAIRLNPIALVTKEAFTVPIKAELILNITRKNAPWVIAIAGSQDGLINDVVVPFLYDIAGRVFSGKSIKELIGKREEIREEVEAAVKEGLGNYPIDLIAFRITQFDFESSQDKETRKYADILAEQKNVDERKRLLKNQIAFQKRRIDLMLTKATADNQEIVARATLQREAASIQKDTINIRKEAFRDINPLTALIADPDAAPGLVTAVSGLFNSLIKNREVKPE